MKNSVIFGVLLNRAISKKLAAMMEEVRMGSISKKDLSAAVVVRNAYKGYTQNSLILKNLNLTVPEGVMWVFLMFTSNIYNYLTKFVG